MESETNPNNGLKPPPLNSDQLNYLIWRYLQEAGYGEAAVKLQRDWKVEPENLPFAKHIRGQALVSLVQKGLRYHHLSLTIDENGQSVKQLNPSTFFFGPESGRPATSSSSKDAIFRQNDTQRASSPLTNISIIPKKRDSEPNAVNDANSTSAKRSRKTTQSIIAERNGNGNGIRTSSLSANEVSSTMDIDHVNGNVGISNNIRSPSVGENMYDDGPVNGVGSDSRMDVDMDDSSPGVSGVEQIQTNAAEGLPPLLPTLTNGESIGIQVAPAKVANLGPSATVLSLPAGSHVTRSTWRPTDWPLLTVAGDHFCGAWKQSNQISSDGKAKMMYQDLLGNNESYTVTAIAWEPSGGLLAIATYSNHAGQLHLFDGRELMLFENPPASQRAIISLKWLPSAFKLVGIAPYEDQSPNNDPSSTLLVWDFSDMQFSASPLTLTVPEVLLSVDTFSHAGTSFICVAGCSAVYYCRIDGEIILEKKFSTTDKTNWDFVKCASYGDDSGAIVVASSESAQIWIPAKNVRQNEAHKAAITAFEVRSRAFTQSGTGEELEFATSSMDGFIKVWRWETSSIELRHRLVIDQGFPIMSLAYSPDGFCLAGASFNNARIWNAEHGYNLMAAWEGSREEWRGTVLKDEDTMSAGGLSSVNGDSGNADHSLAWDLNSKKLAFGLASQVALIDFQR